MSASLTTRSDFLDPLSRCVEEAYDAIIPEASDIEELVDLVARAVDSLTGPVLRGAASGKPSVVTVPDQKTAAIFRMALSQTSAKRPTDALVEIVVDPKEAGRA